MCVSKTLVAIKQGEFPGGRLLGDTGNRQDAGPTLLTQCTFSPHSILKRFNRFVDAFFMVVSFIHSAYPISEQMPNLQIPH